MFNATLNGDATGGHQLRANNEPTRVGSCQNSGQGHTRMRLSQAMRGPPFRWCDARWRDGRCAHAGAPQKISQSRLRTRWTARLSASLHRRVRSMNAISPNANTASAKVPAIVVRAAGSLAPATMRVRLAGEAASLRLAASG
jgi:hypothetical protein